MSNPNQDEIYMDLDSWSKLVSNPEFQIFILELKKRIDRYTKKVDGLAGSFSAEANIEIRNWLSRKDEMQRLLKFFSHKVEEKKRYIQKETLNGKGNIRTD